MKSNLPAMSLAMAHPGYAQLAARKAELNQRLAAIRDERIALLEVVRDERPELPQPQAREAPAMSPAAAALLGGLLPAPTIEHAPVVPATAMGRLRDLAAEEAALREALAILSEPLAAARAEASAKVAGEVAPELRLRARALAAAVLAMAEAAHRYQALAAELDREGVDIGGLAPIRAVPGGWPGATYSEVRAWLREAAAAGHLDVKALPSAWREGVAAAA
jgi:hypothetical protein